jgi:uncharacterized surface protein with fasciclin (FAS1) repeats
MLFATGPDLDSKNSISSEEICQSTFLNPFSSIRRTVVRNSLVRSELGEFHLRKNKPHDIMKTIKSLFRPLLCVLAIAGMTATSYAAEEKKDIVDTAVAAGSFKTLAAALKAAGLIETLKGPGPFTVFAPTDAAFAKLPEGTVETLLKPENKEKLVDILTYHVVSGNVAADAAMKMKEATALNKKTIALEVKDAALYLNKSKVVTADVKCSNGTIHIIDAVLMPPAAK